MTAIGREANIDNCRRINSTMRILMADEDRLMLESFALLFSGKHDIKTALNGETCLMLYFMGLYESRGAGRNPFDLVILNYDLRRKSGVEVAKDILSMNPNQRIVMISRRRIDPLELQGLNVQALQETVRPDDLNKFMKPELSAMT